MPTTKAPKFRKVLPFPAAHMRLIGEICVQWTHIELLVLQAVCEANEIDSLNGAYLGSRVSFPDRLGLLEGIAGSIKEEAKNRGQAGVKHKSTAKRLHTCIADLRSAYLLRCKYAHAEMTPSGRGKPPYIHRAQLINKIVFEDRPLLLEEMIADSDAIFDAGEAFLSFMNEFGLCKKPWF